MRIVGVFICLVLGVGTSSRFAFADAPQEYADLKIAKEVDGVEIATASGAVANSARARARDVFQGKSFALIVGVGSYEHRAALSCISTDASRMRDFLLVEQGYEAVFTMIDGVATPDGVRHYLLNVFRQRLSPQDRLLVYLSLIHI